MACSRRVHNAESAVSRALREKLLDSGSPDPASAPGDRRNLSVQPSHVVGAVILYGSMTHRRAPAPPRAAVVLAVASLAALAALGASSACRGSGNRKATMTHAPYGRLSDGATVEIFTLTNASGTEVRTIPYGAIIVSIRVPDRSGRLDDVVLGFDTLDGYVMKSRYFGAVVGRYGNRIAQGRFALDGRTYQLATNNGVNHLHGGVKGFDKVVWRAEPFQRDGAVGVAYSLTSPDGDEGYPGTLAARVTYTLTPSNEVTVEYDASTDRATPVNLTQHSYFNLAGEGSGDILDHRLTIDADRFTPVDATLIPTGELAPVEGTPFDFRHATVIGARIDTGVAQLQYGTGYDHNWVLNRRSSQGPQHAARVEDPKSGRTLDVSTTEPGLQFYAGNFLDGTITGKAGHVYGRRSGLCLETQHFPDSPNHADFPSAIVRPGRHYQSTTVFAFGVSR
jgi:aldose 1-epimerase